VFVFDGKADVHEIACKRDMIRLMCPNIVDYALQCQRCMNFPSSEVPRQISAQTLVEQLGNARAGQRPKMKIRQMRKLEHSGWRATVDS
jgi:hypothetical protein